MVIQNTVISFEQLVQDFDGLFEHRVFRLETLDYYDAPNEHEPYRRFLAGERADLAWREPWKRLVRDVRASGRTMERVHVVSEPVSDYIRFELLDVYPANADAGEDVRILSRSEAWPSGLDFWLFDDDLAALLKYDSGGRVSEVRLIEDDMAVRHHLGAVRTDALNLSVPLGRYVAERNITERKQAA